jgi:primosomal protein N' (replication factor Y)
VQRYCRVAIDSPVRALDRPFDYEIPERMLGRIGVGSVVRVNLHGRNVRAFVIELLDEAAVAKPRALSSLVGAEPLFTEATVALAAWTARRYVVPLGVVLHDAVPGRFSAPTSTEPVSRDANPAVTRPAWLKDDLPDAGDTCVVVPSINDEPELVAHAVARARTRSRSALVIAPRVDLVERIAAAVPGSVVLHGEDKPAERAAAWAAARDGTADVVVGGRSALFVPMRDLGLVVVVSAHDRSLRGERTPRLHALHVARRRAQLERCAFIASSPAPPLDVAGADNVTTLGAKRSPVRPETTRPRKGPVTPRLIEVVTDALANGRDALVFVGRRGDVLRLRCTDCGWAPTCDVCGAGLAFDRPNLRCRVCGATATAPDECPYCGGALSERGWGHERVARTIEKEIDGPVVRIVKGSEPFVRTGPTVVVGTIAAAYAMRQAGAVVVSDLDQLLTRPDFRAAEVALQTLHELAGVLVPGGRFLVQTREPEHHVVQAFTRGSYAWFLERELPLRRETSYPPFGVVVRMEIEEGALDALARSLGSDARVIGALPRRGRLVALVRAPELEPLLDPLRRFSTEHPRTKIDVDPTDIS